MGLLDKTAQLNAPTHKGGLLSKVANIRYSPTPTAVLEKEDYTNTTIQKKKSHSFKSFIDASERVISSTGENKVGLLFSSADYYMPYLLSGYDKTSLNKFRINSSLLSSPFTCLKKSQFKNALSLREFLNDDDRDFYFHFPSTGASAPILMVRNKLEPSFFKDYGTEIEIISNELVFISKSSDQSVIFTSEDELKPHILTAQLENMNIHRFSFSFSHFIEKLGLPVDTMQGSFILHVINSVILSTFQRSALSLKTDDTLHLYFFSVSAQNPNLLRHQINRTLSQYFFGATESIVEIVQLEHQ